MLDIGHRFDVEYTLQDRGLCRRLRVRKASGVVRWLPPDKCSWNVVIDDVLPIRDTVNTRPAARHSASSTLVVHPFGLDGTPTPSEGGPHSRCDASLERAKCTPLSDRQ